MAEAKTKTILRYGYRFKNPMVIGLLRVIDALLQLVWRKTRPLPAKVAKILLMKPDHLGDMLMVTSLLPFIKKAYPEASIDLLCGPWAMPVLVNNPHLRQVITLSHPAYNRSNASLPVKMIEFCRSLSAAVRTLRREQYDICLNLRDAGGDLILLARIGRCRFIAGHRTGGLAALLDGVAEWREGIHETGHYLEVARLVGVDPASDEPRYELFPSAADYAVVDELLQLHGLDDYVVIHPGCGDKRKLKPPEFWAEIIRSTGSSRVAVTGSSDEQALFAQIQAVSPTELLDLTGGLTITQLLVLFQRARTVFTLDSLAGHIAALSGAEVVIFWHQLNDPRQWRPLGEKVTTVMPDSDAGVSGYDLGQGASRAYRH